MLKELRKKSGTKVKDIADKLSCSRSTVYQIESGKSSGHMFGEYYRLLGMRATDITRLRTGLHKQTDIED